MLKKYLAKATENVTTGVKWNHHTVSCTVNGQRLVTCKRSEGVQKILVVGICYF